MEYFYEVECTPPTLIFFQLNKKRESLNEFETLSLFVKITWAHFLESF